MTIAEALSTATARLTENEVSEPRREAASLLSFVLQKNTAFLIAHPEYQLAPTENDAFENVVTRRSAREPYQYIVGRQEFYGLDFEVVPGVLIPRPETEILVEAAIKILADSENPNFLEIGVGTGCISVSILHHAKHARADAVDISDAALDLAARNAAKHEVAGRLTLSKGDLYHDITTNYDLIVSNPPYIPDTDLVGLQPEVGKFEPHTALFGGHDGLSVVRRIIAAAPEFLKPAGCLLIEIGFGQSASVKELFDPEIWGNVDFIPDFQGIPRIAKARLLA